jgi:MoxR-like ATPase
MFGNKKKAAPAEGEVLTPGFLRFRGTDEYITSGPLEQAVNAAIALERPLLIKGEPGTGKTMLAEQIAKGLGKSLLRWQIKSTTRAADGLYVYERIRETRPIWKQISQ